MKLPITKLIIIIGTGGVYNIIRARNEIPTSLKKKIKKIVVYGFNF